MQSKQEEREALQQRINAHPLLDLPPQQRLQNARGYTELVELLLRYYAFDRKIQQALHSENGPRKEDSVLLRHEDALLEARYQPKHRHDTFDGVAFMEAAREAIQRYEAGRGAAFTTYFIKLYEQRLLRVSAQVAATREQRVFGPLRKEQLQLLKKLDDLLQRRNSPYTPQTLPESAVASLAEELGMAPERVRGVLVAVRMSKAVAPCASGEGEEEDASVLEVADPDVKVDARHVEAVEELAGVLDVLCDTDQKEYTRLFMTNDVLSPLKEEDSAADPVAYGRVLLRYEAELFRAVFERPYLCFVFEEKPVPDSVRNIVAGRLRLPLRDSSIVAYKKSKGEVRSASGVSNARKRFEKLRVQLRKQLECPE